LALSPEEGNNRLFRQRAANASESLNCELYVGAGSPEQSFIRSINQRPAGPGGADVG
jgi:hypothetical protein